MKKYFFIAIIIFTWADCLKAQTVLNANGPGKTYELISSVLAPGYFPIETPDCSHVEFGRHIDEIWDSTLNAYVFRFFIHVTPDNDRCINFDRQRNEIKVYDRSPDKLKAFLGDSIVYSWEFKLDSSFQPSTGFTHIHQLKAVGGNDKLPLITFTPRKGSTDKLQIRYADSTSIRTLTSVNLSLFKGCWVAVSEHVLFAEKGAYEVTFFRVSDSTIIFHYKNSNIKMWRKNANFIRPKWGIYRSLLDQKDLRDEKVLFNSFEIEKVGINAVLLNPYNEQVVFFPNPTNDKIFIQKGVHLSKIMDLMGKPIYFHNSQNHSMVDISKFPKGIYILEFNKENKILTRKLIIK